MLPNHLTPEELAKRWSVKSKTLSQWRWNGRGPKFLKLGRHVMYRLADIEEFENQNIYIETTQPIQPLAAA